MTNNTAKWTSQQDKLLLDGVQRYGLKWELIKTHMKDIRSVNSIIKRWHAKVKYDRLTNTQKPDEKPRHHLRKHGQPQPTKPVVDQILPMWKKIWSLQQDQKLKILVVQNSIMNWKLLAQTLEAQEQQIKLRWKKVIYPTFIRQSFKVGGSMKWSTIQDRVLTNGFKCQINWEAQGKYFLPTRSLGSLEARWRRIGKSHEVILRPVNRLKIRRRCLKRIALLKKGFQYSESQKQLQANKNQNNDSEIR